MLYGYVRTGLYEKNLDLQLDVLERYGIQSENIVVERNIMFNSKLEKLIGQISKLGKGDTLVIWRLDRVANSTKNFIKLMNKLVERKIIFYCVTIPSVNTSSSYKYSELLIQLFACLYELQKSVLNENIRLGLEISKRNGKIIGAPRGLSQKNKIKAKKCAKHYKKGKRTVLEICEKVGVSKSTFYKYLEYHGVRIKRKQKRMNPNS
ncbi:recombinase family protein [Cellulophaga sp. HaHa_2_95]|uniref:recombinase family protein n=1 Tax=Cellulophaga sp. HaHa_2_95 TaxID=2745558 RepID=UPI001C4EEFC9|nr:recombinase family protein [Cellulophaga sp. HaHa_2_95]QXP54662.1 recombinase family protein [Cellulophaga sp. HaHa_2_95]